VNGEHRTPPALIASIVLLVLGVGIAAYYIGRFGRPARMPAITAESLPPPAAPAPAAGETVATPAEIPPTITPPIPVVVEKGRRSSQTLLERSTQIVVPVPPAPSVALPAAATGELPLHPTEKRRIVIEVRPTLTPTPPARENRAPPPLVETPIPPLPPPEPPEEETPEPEPTARPFV
jgi:hypothetical protein